MVVTAKIAAKIKSFFIGKNVGSGAIERSRTDAFPLILLAFFFLFFALLVFLYELAIGINFDAPLLALFVYHGFVNGFALFCLLLDLHDLVTASLIFDCRLRRLGQARHLNGLLFFFCGRQKNRTGQTADYGNWYCCDCFFHWYFPLVTSCVDCCLLVLSRTKQSLGCKCKYYLQYVF